MRGEPGTPVMLTVVRKDVDTPLTFTLLRQEINVKSVRSKMLEPGYGFVRVRKFQEHTGEDLAKALKDLYAQGRRSRASCSTCAAIRAACSTRRWPCRPPSCRRTRWSSTPTAARPTRACA